MANNVGEISLSLLLDSDKFEKSLDEASKKAGGIGSALGTAAKVGAAAVGSAAVVAGKEVADLTKESVAAYADYEQLVGGVETLFKSSSDQVMQYADNAYKTSGLSANEYMETVTSFSASLLQSLDGDTAAAAKTADQAIVDMADNANKMGTSMSSIQTAYQGFAKQNYTMLDNLKLGYGGTKQEMERLLEDAQAISGVEYNIDSYADVVNAIHVIQDEMGITGTTAREAGETISGSLASAKSAWENLVTGLANKDADLSGLIDNFVNSALTVADNIVPIVEKALEGIAELVEKIVPKLIEMLPGLIDKIIPPLINAIKTIMDAILKALPGLIKTLLPVIIELLVEGFKIIIEIIPDLIQMIADVLPDTIKSLIEGITTLIVAIAEILPDLIPIIIDAVIDTLPVVIQAIGEAIPQIVAAINVAVIKCLPQLIDGLIAVTAAIVKNIPLITKEFFLYMPRLISDILTTLFPVSTGLGDIFGEGVKNIMNELSVVADWIEDNVVEPIKDFFEPFIEFIQSLFENLVNIIKAVLIVAGNFVKEHVVEPIKKFFEEMFNKINEAFTKVRDSIVKVFEEIKTKASDVVNKIKEFFKPVYDWFEKNVTSKIANCFRKMWEGITDGIKGALNSAIGMIERFINKVISGINKFISAINRASRWASKITGGSVGSISEISEVSLPRLASGGFVEANTPQLAIIGDNKHEGEIVAPESKIAEAVAAGMRTALSALSFTQSQQQVAAVGDITIPIYLDGSKLESVTIKSEKINNLRTGAYR